MTRSQAGKIAERIKQAARDAAAAHPAGPQTNWTEIDIQLPGDLATTIMDNARLVVGAMPMGWTIVRRRGHETLTIARRAS